MLEQFSLKPKDFDENSEFLCTDYDYILEQRRESIQMRKLFKER